MNLIFRLLRIVIAARLRPRIGVTDETRVSFRVWPTDLDFLRHLTNSRYFALMDLGRLDMVLRNGFSRAVKQHGWYPVVASETIRFRRSLNPFERFEIRTRSLGWDHQSFYMQQVFVCRGHIAAVALIRVRFLMKDGSTVDAAELVETLSPGVKSPPLPHYVTAWRDAERDYSAPESVGRHAGAAGTPPTESSHRRA